MTSLSHHMDLDWMKEAYRRTRKDGAVGIDGQLDDQRFVFELAGADLRQIDRDGLLEERRGNDEDHQQDQHDVDQRRRVDLGHGLTDAGLVEAAESHAQPARPLRAASRLTRLASLPIRTPVVR